MTSIHDAANGLADEIAAGIANHPHPAHEHPEYVTTPHFVALIERVKALEAGVVIPEPEESPTSVPPAPDAPWEPYRVAHAASVVVPDRWDRVTTAASVRDAMRSGYGALVPDGLVIDIGAFNEARGGLRAEGNGATIRGDGSNSVITTAGPTFFHNIRFLGRGISGRSGEDGARIATGGNPWFDKCSFENVTDESVDLWGTGSKRATFTRCAFGTGDGVANLGPLLGNNPDGDPVPVDQWATFYRCHFETAQRQPRVAAPGAVGHVVNCVHPWWWAGGHMAIHASWGGVVIVEGSIFGADNTGGGTAVGTLQGSGGVYVEGAMRTRDGVAINPSSARAKPSLPYAAIPYEYRQSRAEQIILGRLISADAGPAFTTKRRAL